MYTQDVGSVEPPNLDENNGIADGFCNNGWMQLFVMRMLLQMVELFVVYYNHVCRNHIMYNFSQRIMH